MPKPLEDLRIEGYRLFQDITLPTLGRVNLVTGRNNTGKSALLEAVRLYAQAGASQTIGEIMDSRDELALLSDTRGEIAPDWRRVGIRNLFFGRREDLEDVPPIRISTARRPEDALEISFAWHWGLEEAGFTRWVPVGPDQTIAPGLTELEECRPGLQIRSGSETRTMLIDDARWYARSRAARRSEQVSRNSCVAVSAGGLDADRVGELWDSVALTDLEDEVLNALRVIAPEVERVSLLGGDRRARERAVFVKLPQPSRPVPLRSLGDGMNRLLGLTLALVNSRDGLLLIDEVENGLHFSVQLDLWRLVFRVAAELNIQVFATTHSYDAIVAFQEAARQHPKDGVLIRLERKQDHFRVTSFNEDRLAVVARDEIEVR